jgi:hypothetical protein
MNLTKLPIPPSTAKQVVQSHPAITVMKNPFLPVQPADNWV